MKKILSVFVLLFAGFFGFIGDADAYTLRITCRSKGREIELCKKAIDEWIAKHNGKHKVEIVTLPHASNECFALYQQWLSAGTFDIDILQMDVVWVGVFSDYLASLEGFYNKDDIKTDDYFDSVKKNMYNDGHLVALPWYTDCGIMYYRKDLLEKYRRSVPKTWEELYETALYIQNEERKEVGKKNKFYGLVLQAKAFEVLTCNFAELVDSFGGSIVEDGKAVVNSRQSINSVMFLIKCIRNVMSRSVLNYSEEDARGVFQSGNAVFMRSWPYAWALLNDPATSVADKVGVMQIPPSASGGKSSGVLGGWFLAVSKYSKHAEVAADLIKFLTSKSQQKMRSKYSYLPAFKSLYTDENVLKNNPFFASIHHSLQNAVARPSIAFGKNYSRASSEIYNCINTVLTDSVESDISVSEVKKALNRMNKKLDAILKKKMANNKKADGSKVGFFHGITSWIKNFLGFNNEAVSSTEVEKKSKTQ